MKWKEFMELVKKSDIKDEDEIWFIDFGGGETELCIAYEDKLGWHIS